MAAILELLGCVALGLAIGWRLRSRRDAHAASEAAVDRLAAEWAEHVRLHAETQAGSVVLTAAPAFVACDAGADPPAARAVQ